MLAITWRAQAARRLEAAGSPDPMADARLLSWGDSLREISPQEEARLEQLAQRRQAQAIKAVQKIVLERGR